MTSTLPPTTHPRLLTLEIRDGGYLNGLRFAFAPHTTCIIGGKGAGKTTVFEALRFVCDSPALLPKDTTHSLLRRNLHDATVRVTFETEHGVRYVAQRTLKDERTKFFTPEGKEVKLSADVLATEAYGQDEIERVGGSRASQRDLLDRLAGDELRPYAAEIADVRARLGEGAKALLTLEKEIVALEAGASEARAIDEQLKPLLVATGADAEIATKAHAAKGLRNREKQAVTQTQAALSEVREAAEAFVATSRRRLQACVPGEVVAGENGAVLQELERILAGLDETLRGFAANVAEATAAAAVSVGKTGEALAALHATQDGAYEAFLAVHKEDQARTETRSRLQARHAEIAGAVPLLEERSRTHARLRAEQDALADRLVELRDRRSRVRVLTEQKYHDSLEADGVRFKVHQDQELDEYRAYLRPLFAAFTNNQPKWLIEKVVAAFSPDRLVAVVRAQDQETLIKKAGLANTADRAKQAIAALTKNEHLYALQAIAIDDEVVIEARHGEVWKDTVECSPGQRSGAILPILLVQGKSTLLIDQPDDNVDPDFMCNAILPRVAALEGARQFVFVSHHANVPVLSRAQQIVLIGSDGKSGRVEAEGTLGKMTSFVVAKLEGGKSAFETRKKTYETEPTSAAANPPDGRAAR